MTLYLKKIIFIPMRRRPNYFLPVGIAIGAGIGVALNNIAIGMGIGVALGFAMSAVVQNRNREK
jgi:hypothetical protein